ncbi:hypothetical protein MMC18_009701 [Xylographa bjoerkii]|nr:hypothetical protein [Xylographa bjoerkii]
MDSLCAYDQETTSIPVEGEHLHCAEVVGNMYEEVQLSESSDDLSFSSETSSTSYGTFLEFGYRHEDYTGTTASMIIRALDLVLPEDTDLQTKSSVTERHDSWLEIREHNYLAAEMHLSRYSRNPWDGSDDNESPENAEDLETAEETKLEHEQPYFHHLNFHNQPVNHKSATPPEVSFWLIMTETTPKPRYSRFCRDLVIASQAGKLIDPVHYRGPDELLKLEGSALRDAITGHVDIAYQPLGAWGRDYYSSDEVVPVCTTTLNNWFDGKYNRGPPRGYTVSSCDGDVLVNDDGRLHSMQRASTKAVGRSKLCIVQYVEEIHIP